MPVHIRTRVSKVSLPVSPSRNCFAQVLTIALPAFHSIDEALRHLGQFIGHVPEWRELIGFLPADLRVEQ